jgi:hypothetical protein
MKFKIFSFIVPAVLFSACAQDKCYTLKTSWGPVCLPRCKAVVEYQAHSFTIKGVKIPVPQLGGDAQVGEVSWDAKVLNHAFQTTQLLDRQLQNDCQQLPAYASLGRDQFQLALDRMTDREYRLGQLAFLVALGAKQGVKEWIRDNSGLVAPESQSSMTTTETAPKLTATAKAQPPKSPLKPLRAYFSKP